MSARFWYAAALSAAAAGMPATARADRFETSAALTLNALDGSHAVNGGETARIDFVPLPLAELAARRGRDALHLEGLPPVAFSYGGGSAIGAATTRLSIANLTYRRTLGGGWFVGFGQTLYDQHTTYGAVFGTAIYTRRGTGPFDLPRVYRIYGAEEQYSRVTGPRIEAGATWGGPARRLELLAALNPAMHGVQYTAIPTIAQGTVTFADPERASQLDLSARIVSRAGRHGEFLYGLRYLHYSGRYVDDPGQLADRNAGIAPTIGYRLSR